ncbi:MAG: response regulator [Planctomycetota bacterium]
MDQIRLLYVEDSKVAQKLLERVIEPVAEFTGVEDLAGARALVAQSVYSMVVLDYELPDGDGLELARELRADERYKDVPLVLYCSSVNNELEYEAMKAGVNESFAKPMNMLELREHLVRHLETPSFKQVRRELVQIAFVEWEIDGKHYAYCPAWNKRVVGPSGETVRAAMQEQIESAVAAADPDGELGVNPSLCKHVVQLTDEAA